MQLTFCTTALLIVFAVSSQNIPFEARYVSVYGGEPLPVQYVPIASLPDHLRLHAVNSVRVPEPINDKFEDLNKEKAQHNEEHLQKVNTSDTKTSETAVENGPLTHTLTKKDGHPVLTQVFDPKKVEEDMSQYEIVRTERLHLPNYSHEMTVRHRNPMNPFTLATLQKLHSSGSRNDRPVMYGPLSAQFSVPSFGNDRSAAFGTPINQYTPNYGSSNWFSGSRTPFSQR